MNLETVTLALKAVQMHQSGMSRRTIAFKLDVEETRVTYWLYKFDETVRQPRLKVELTSLPRPRTMWKLKGCPRCGGDCYADYNHYRFYYVCLQCGWREEHTAHKLVPDRRMG